MLNSSVLRKAFASCLLVAISSVSSMFALAAETQPATAITAALSVTGDVTIDGRTALSNSTVVSGSTITTGEKTNSIATIELGKLGRVELLSQSSAVLKFDNNGIYATLLIGKVRVMNAAGVTTTVATKEGIVAGDTAQSNTFIVETECGRTAVNTTNGSAVLRAEGQEARQVAAGSESVAGNLQQTGCRPCVRPFPDAPFPSIGAFGIPVIIAGAAAAALAVLSGRNGVETGGAGSEGIGTGGAGFVVVSPNR